MESHDEDIERYHTLNPAPMPFTHLVRLDTRLYQAPLSDEREQMVELWLGKPSKVLDPQRLRLTLYNALPAKSCWLCPSMSVFIDILSIRDRQWSGLSYVVRDLEGTTDLFYCRNFEVKLENFYLDTVL